MTKHLAVELGPKKIRVVGICPGPIENTAGMEKLSQGDPNEITRIMPLQRNGKISQIADAALFLASDGASFITGDTIIVDGGQTLTFPNMPFMSKDFVEAYSPKL